MPRRIEMKLDPAVSLEEAVRRVLENCPRTTFVGIMARLRSYGWLAENKAHPMSVVRLLKKMEESGTVHIDRSARRFRYCLEGESHEQH